ncbi:MAG: hypothetical protein ACXWJD_12685 [Burkholderiaceae bacterium]
MGTFAEAATPTCRFHIEQSLQILKRREGEKLPSRKPYVMPCWHDVPELYRNLIARAAGLSPKVVKKVDRDLTEQEKVMLRSAARDLSEVAGRLVSL